METMEIRSKFVLPKKKVQVKPIKRARGMIKDPNHYGFFLIPGSYVEFTAPAAKNGEIECPLNEEERNFFESSKLSGLPFKRGDLSPYKKEDNYWKSKSGRVKLRNQEYNLDLSNPKDYLTYKILLSNKKLIAPSASEIKNKATYLFAIVEEDEELKLSLTKVEKTKKAWKFFGKVEDSKEKMINFLKAFGKKPSFDAKTNFLKNEISKIIEDPKGLNKMISIIDNPNYEYLVLINDAVQAGILNKKSGRYYLDDGTPLAEAGQNSNVETAIEYLKNNQEIELTIIARIKEKREL